MIRGSGCNSCPGKDECRAQLYRGNMCFDIREGYGLGDPFTHSDRIRTMSDEELAAIMTATFVDEQIHYCQNRQECEDAMDRGEDIPEEKFIACLVEWLQSPAEEVNDG